MPVSAVSISLGAASTIPGRWVRRQIWSKPRTGTFMRPNVKGGIWWLPYRKELTAQVAPIRFQKHGFVIARPVAEASQSRKQEFVVLPWIASAKGPRNDG
jgi:hypothetical protein